MAVASHWPLTVHGILQGSKVSRKGGGSLCQRWTSHHGQNIAVVKVWLPGHLANLQDFRLEVANFTSKDFEKPDFAWGRPHFSRQIHPFIDLLRLQRFLQFPCSSYLWRLFKLQTAGRMRYQLMVELMVEMSTCPSVRVALMVFVDWCAKLKWWNNNIVNLYVV